MAYQEDYINMIYPKALEIGRKYGLDPVTIMTQAVLETGWGRQVAGNNHFGVKSHGRSGGVQVTTHEHVNGKPVKIRDSFRAYDNWEDSMEDYAKFLQENPRYGDALKQSGYANQLQGLADAGYATDVNYATKMQDVARSVVRRLPQGGLPYPPGEIPNIVATQQDTADLTQMAPQPASASDRDKARSERVNVSPGVIDIRPRTSGGGGQESAETFQMESAVPLPRTRPKDTEQLTPVPESKVEVRELLPLLAPPPGFNGDPGDRVEGGVIAEVPTVGGTRNNPRSREDTGQSRKETFQLTPPARILERQLSDQQVRAQLLPQSQANPDIFSLERAAPKIPQSQIERVVLRDAGSKSAPLIGGMGMPELNQLGKLAPHVTNLENITAQQTQLRQQEQAAVTQGQGTLRSQNTVKDIQPAAAKPEERNILQQIGDELIGELKDLFTMPGGESETPGKRSGSLSGKSSGSSNSGSGSSDSTKWTGKSGTTSDGRSVREFESRRFNADTNQFEDYKGFK